MDELKEGITKSLENGLSREEIIKECQNAGWNIKEIEYIINDISGVSYKAKIIFVVYLLAAYLVWYFLYYFIARDIDILVGTSIILFLLIPFIVSFLKKDILLKFSKNDIFTIGVIFMIPFFVISSIVLGPILLFVSVFGTISEQSRWPLLFLLAPAVLSIGFYIKLTLMIFLSKYILNR